MALGKFCPGSSLFKNPMPETIECPNCGTEVEIWSDELKARCPNCKEAVYKNRAPSCIDWCQHAKDCVGPELWERLKGEEVKS